MKSRLVSIIFSIVFMALLLVPLFFIDPEGGKISEDENRILTKRPPVSMMRESLTEYTEQFDGWFKDSIGFREEMISLYDQLNKIERYGQYHEGFHRYLIGDEGHIFLDKDEKMVPTYQGKPVFDDDTLTRLSASLNGIKAYLDDQGIPMVVMLCTDKETIYPEYYPKTIIRGPEPGQLDIITNYLIENTDVDLFNIKQRLLSDKENYLVYDKAVGDLQHYNEIGAFFAYQELMQHINKYLPEIEPFTLEDIDIIYDKDNVPTTNLKQEISYEVLGTPFLSELEPPSPKMWKNNQIENTIKGLPNILLFTDSYMELKYIDTLPEHFSKTGLIHYEYIANLKEFVEYYEPDIVVFESAERELRAFATNIINYYENVLEPLGY